MDEFQGDKFIALSPTATIGGDYYSSEYVEWLENQIELLRRENLRLRTSIACEDKALGDMGAY